MGESELIAKITEELLGAQKILETEYSFDLAEPNYVRCLQLIKKSPDQQPIIEAVLIDLFDKKKIGDEPLAYLMHYLRWPGVRDWVESRLRETTNAIAFGASYEKILNAYEEDWENLEFYKGFE